MSMFLFIIKWLNANKNCTQLRNSGCAASQTRSCQKCGCTEMTNNNSICCFVALSQSYKRKHTPKTVREKRGNEERQRQQNCNANSVTHCEWCHWTDAEENNDHKNTSINQVGAKETNPTQIMKWKITRNMNNKVIITSTQQEPLHIDKSWFDEVENNCSLWAWIKNIWMTGAESAPIHAYKFWGLGGWLVKDYMSNQPFGMFWSLIVDHPKLSNYQECRGLHVCKSYRKSEVYGYAHLLFLNSLF